MQEPNYTQVIQQNLSLRPSQVEAVLTMTEEGATVPFIARYRKERTGGLDENQIRDILELKKKEENLYKAKVTALNGIEEQGLLNDEIRENIEQAKTLKEVEDLYKPYKLKKKTKAMLALEKGFGVVAELLKTNRPFALPADLLAQYGEEEILEGAQEIVAAEISSSAQIREVLRNYLSEKGILEGKIKSEKMLEKLNEKTKSEVPKFALYTEFSTPIARVKPYQTLALNRGESLGILTVKIDKDEASLELVEEFFAKEALQELLKEAIKKGWTALFASVENELRAALTEIAEDESIRTFQSNLSNLLMTRAEYGKRVLGVDPGYRTGCKIVVLDEGGNPLAFSKIYLHQEEEAKKIFQDLDKKYEPQVIVVGNGTASDETVELIGSTLSQKIYIVNESGASVYSASKVAQEEFAELDATDRGTVSIARRYIDPLSELVKIPVGSIGVGMYQHDMPESKLEEKLGFTVEDVVNLVGVNVNTASVHVLNHISGFDKRTAKKVYAHRPYKNREQLRKILSEKVFEQAAGFLRVPESEEALDNTNIHPEQYALAKFALEKNLGKTDFASHESQIKALYPDANRDTLEFIITSYQSIGKDPRVYSSHREVGKKITLDSIEEGMIVEGVVRNVVAFGAFVDVGLKNDGLVHISQIANHYVADPLDFVQVGQKVRVKIVGIDKDTQKIQLSMKEVQ